MASPPDFMDHAKVAPEHLLEHAGAVSDMKESEPVSLPKGEGNKHLSRASVSGHPQGKQARPNNKKKKMQQGEDFLHECYVHNVWGPRHG